MLFIDIHYYMDVNDVKAIYITPIVLAESGR